MQILFDHQKFTDQNYGGITRYFANLALNLHNLEQDIKIIAPIHSNEYLLDLSHNIVVGRYTNFSPHRLRNVLSKANTHLSQYYERRYNPDIVHETYYSDTRILKSKCKRVLTVYDMIHERFNSSFSSTDNTIALKKKAISRADHIIAISDSTKKDLIEMYNIDEKKITTIHLSWSESIIKANIKNKKPIIDRPYLLYVGARAGYKNFNSLVKSLSLSKKLKNNINLISFGGPSFDNEELKMMNDLNFDKNQIIHMKGDDSLLANLYQNAIAFIFPSFYEGFGIPPLEAMANKCPVISSNTSVMPEVIGNAAEYFNPDSVENLMYAIEKVVFSDIRKKELIQLGLDRVKLFSWKKCSNQTLSLYKTLL